ncbi:hypothetical protein [Streptosporangium sp. NPDC000396]|uniref:hypothetical protein n=1 Tax=Streptosporangium sp. NPDC000396 TaxID=3366185 RepID=UPI0036854936
MRAVIALALVALAGCSSPAARPFTPVDLPAGAASSLEEPAPTLAPKAEAVEAGPGVRVVVEWPAGADPDMVKMIDTYREYRARAFKAIIAGGGDATYLDTVQDDATWAASAWIRKYLDRHESVRGTSRLYAPNLVAVVDRGAQLNICVDETEMRLLNGRTGKVIGGRSGWAREPFLQIVGLRRGDDGVWRIKLFQYASLPDERVKGCLR